MSQNKVTNKRNLNQKWVLRGQIFPSKWLGNAWSCSVLVRNDQKNNFQTQGVPATGDWACAPWLQQHFVSAFFLDTLKFSVPTCRIRSYSCMSIRWKLQGQLPRSTVVKAWFKQLFVRSGECVRPIYASEVTSWYFNQVFIFGKKIEEHKFGGIVGGQIEQR